MTSDCSSPAKSRPAATACSSPSASSTAISIRLNSRATANLSSSLTLPVQRFSAQRARNIRKNPDPSALFPSHGRGDGRPADPDELGGPMIFDAVHRHGTKHVLVGEIQVTRHKIVH